MFDFWKQALAPQFELITVCQKPHRLEVMNNEKLARLQSLGQGEVTFEQLGQILPTESSYSEPEIDKLLALSQHQLEQQKALARAIHQIRELLNLDDIFGTTTREVCQLLEADRVAVYRFTPNWGGEFVAEFVTPGWVKLVGPEITKIWEDTYVQETQGGRYRNNETFTVDDIYKAGHRQCHIELLEQFQARAYMIVPVLVKDRLWGLLAAYQNSGPRRWQPAAVNMLAQIGVQFGVAVLQAEFLAEMQAEVTERKQAEQKYRTIFENAVEGIFQTTPDGHYLNTNPALVKILGYASPEELIANLTDIGRQLYVDPNRRTEFIHLMQKHKLVSEFQAQVYRKDGRMIWISENARAVYDTNDILLYYEGFVEDITDRKKIEAAVLGAKVAETAKLELEKEITERKQVEEALRSSVATNRALLNAIPDLMFRISKDGIFVNFKAAKENNLPMVTNEFLGKHLYEMLPTEVAQPAMNCVEKALSTGAVQIFESQLLVNNNLLDYEFRIAVSAEDEVMAIVRDITERKQAEVNIRSALEKEKELGELQSRFVTMASHEFRTPLATILSSAELIEHYSHKWSEEKKLTHHQRIQASVKHMTELLNDVLLIGKAEAGKLEFKPTPLNLVKFCRELVEEMELTASIDKIDFHSQAVCTQNQSLTGCMDEKLLRQILSNLLSNAIKYSPSDGTVDFDLICEQGEAVFRIQDQGIGIPLADQEQLFSSFHRASNVGTISGTGLGLAIVKKSIDLHGGSITVKSEVGVGTSFTVTIPLNNQTVTEVMD